MIEFTGFSSVYYQANLPFAPLPNSSIPTVMQILRLGEPPPFVITSTYDASLLGPSVDLTADLDIACDRNHDGVIDAADRFAYATEQE